LRTALRCPNTEVAAAADVYTHRLDAIKRVAPELKTYTDFRQLLDDKSIDAVLIATPQHWHVPIAIAAAKAGKDMYCEKPCTKNVAQSLILRDTMRRTGRVFQAGTQRRSVPNFQKAVELAHSGKLGKLHTLHASIYQPVLDNTWLSAEAVPDPAVVDWNLWLGPAAWRPFNKKYVDGGWRGQWDFDSGARVLDWGAHTIDLCQWANKADDTMPIEYEPHDKNIICHYANGVKLVIDFLPDPFGNRDPHYITRLGTCPVRFIGEEGWVETGDEGEIVVHPDSLQKEISDGGKRVRGLDVSAHARNFFDCIRSRSATAANADVMRRSHIAAHAAALAWILQRKLTLDPAKEEFIGDAEANRPRSRGKRNWTA
jgi:predicted dehydrogenase